MTRFRPTPALVLILALVLAACTVPDEVAEPVSEPEDAATAVEGLGSPAEPIVMSFVPSGDRQEIVTGGEDIARLLAQETGLVLETNVATSYAAVIEAMGAENAHVAWLNTFNYLLAREKHGVEPLLVTERYGTTTYAGEIIARADSGIDSLDDLVGKTFCRPDALSTSGWIVPLVTMRAAGVEERDLGDVVDATSHDAVVTAVYNGDCDAGAVYVDARDGLEDEYPDLREAVVVIAVTDEIPNDNVSVIAGLPEDLRETIKNGLLAISMTEEGREALQATYGIEALQIVEDSFYDEFRATLEQAGVSVDELAQSLE